MKRFRFGLDPLLQQRKWIEEQRALVYAQAQREAARQREKLEALENQYRLTRDALEELKRGTPMASEMRIYIRYLDRLQDQKCQQKTIAEQARQVCEEARIQWQQANRDFKALEALREHAYERHRELGRKEEQKLLDEMGCRYQDTAQQTLM